MSGKSYMFRSVKNKSVTQEIEFGREVESVAVGHKGVVSLILRFHIVYGQLVVPEHVRVFC